MALLSQEGVAKASVRVLTYCDGFELTKGAFNNLIVTYPEFKDYVASIATQREAANKALGSGDGSGRDDPSSREPGSPGCGSRAPATLRTSPSASRVLRRANTHRAHQVMASSQALRAKEGKSGRLKAAAAVGTTSV